MVILSWLFETFIIDPANMDSDQICAFQFIHSVSVIKSRFCNGECGFGFDGLTMKPVSWIGIQLFFYCATTPDGGFRSVAVKLIAACEDSNNVVQQKFNTFGVFYGKISQNDKFCCC